MYTLHCTIGVKWDTDIGLKCYMEGSYITIESNAYTITHEIYVCVC